MDKDSARFFYPSGGRRVVTVPSWARNLPPDELSDDESSPQNTGPIPSRPSNPHAQVTSAREVFANPPPSDDDASTRNPSRPSGDRQREPSHGQQSVASGSTSPPQTPLAPARPEQAHSVIDVQRGAEQRSSAANALVDKGWWTFTLPGKYLDRVHAYVHSDEYTEKGKGRSRERDGSSSDEDEEDERRSMHSARSARSRRSAKSNGGRKERDAGKKDYHRKMSQSMNVHLAPPNVFSINQTQTPGWSTPWTPFQPETNHNARAIQDPFDFTHNTATPSKRSMFEHFILHNPFSPLFFRFINLILAGCTLGIAAHIRQQEENAGVVGVIGSSTLFAIIVTPLAIIHIFVTLYIEYFGLPIGLWKISTKMFYTLTDLLFICLYSAVLSLSFDDLFTSSLQCTAWTPYSQFTKTPAVTGKAGIEGTLADSICSQQIAQVVFIFVSVIAYVGILVISLFRIFAKVTNRGR